MIPGFELRRGAAIITLALTLTITSVHSPDYVEPGDARDVARSLIVIGLSAVLVVAAGLPPVRRLPVAVWGVLGWLVWASLTAPLTAVDPGGSMLVSVAALAAVGGAVALVDRFGFEAFLLALAPSMAVVMAAGALVEIGDGDSGRWEGVAFDFNAFGVLGALGAVAATALTSRQELALPALGIVVAGMAGVWQAGGRMSFLAALLGMGILVSRRMPAALTRTIVVVVGVLLVLVVSVNLEGLVESVARGGNPEDVLGANGRTDVWPVALEGVAEVPLVGHGSVGSSETLARLRDVDSELRFPAAHAHNLPLQVALTNGIPAAMLLVAASMVWAARALQHPLLERDVIGLVVLVVGLTEPIWFGLTPPVIVLGAVFAARALDPAPDPGSVVWEIGVPGRCRLRLTSFTVGADERDNRVARGRGGPGRGVAPPVRLDPGGPERLCRWPAGVPVPASRPHPEHDGRPA